MPIAALIPAYNPDLQLVRLVEALSSSSFAAIVVVDDGSRDPSQSIFREIEQFPRVTLLRHAANLGKGAALKTGLNHVYCRFAGYRGAVLLDADGQHLVQDALKVAAQLGRFPDSLVMGVRTFDREVPLRSRIGNELTGFLFRILTGSCLRDTQSGLRGVPLQFIPHLLKIDSNGYDFELNMLLACKHTGREIVQQSIETVYLERNKSSHFHPVIDSMKIYFVLFRFTLTSLLSALIDNSIFVAVYSVTSSLALSQSLARVVATTFNYVSVRKVVFNSGQKVSSTLPKYLSLVVISGLVSFSLIKILLLFFPLSVIAAKLCAESLVFLVNFCIQRDFIFVKADPAR